jgi:hypothetical protein
VKARGPVTPDDFPDPGPEPARRPGESAAQRRALLEAHAWRKYAHLAVHGADPRWRAWMTDTAWRYVRAGAELPEPMRLWIAYVLQELSAGDAVPTHYRGRPADDARRAERRAAAAQRFAALEAQRPRPLLADRIAQVAHELGMSESAAQKLYKSPGFKELIALYREGQ